MFFIDDEIAYNDYKEYLKSSPVIISVEGAVITTEDFVVEVFDPYKVLLELVKIPSLVDSYKSAFVETHVKPYIPRIIKLYNPEDDIVENSGYKFKTY
jgi:hypothetical protein